MTDKDTQTVELKRSLSLPMLTFYGLGTIVGGGFYALSGKVAGAAGMLAPGAFLLASLIALFSALSFAELSARFPVSAGEAQYAWEAFQLRWLSCLVGWMVIATGIVSAATLADAFALLSQRFVMLPSALVVVAMVVALGLFTAWGISESAWLAVGITAIEVGGLLMVLTYGFGSLGEIPNRWSELIPSLAVADWIGLTLGAYLAFYSFVGFEDLVNVAEEVREPRRNLPLAIIWSLVISGGLYVCISLVLVLSATTEELQRSGSPLALVFKNHPGGGDVITVIGMFAGINGALVQVVMASRVVYGLAKQGQAPSVFARVHPATRTPLEATGLITILVLALALWLPLESLAKITSGILLGVYTLVNLSLWRVKLRTPQPPAGSPCYPLWLPLAGSLICCLFLLVQVWLSLS
jgi:amino acid transporter